MFFNCYVYFSPREAEAITEDSTTSIETTTDTVSSEEEYIKEDSHDGDTKKKIAAIVISSVCAVCLVLLAGLLVKPYFGLSKAIQCMFVAHNEKTSKTPQLRSKMSTGQFG